MTKDPKRLAAVSFAANAKAELLHLSNLSQFSHNTFQTDDLVLIISFDFVVLFYRYSADNLCIIVPNLAWNATDHYIFVAFYYLISLLPLHITKFKTVCLRYIKQSNNQTFTSIPEN